MDYHTLKEEIDNVKGTTFMGMDILTAVKLKGGNKNPYQGRVTKKITDANVIIYSNTEDTGYMYMMKNLLLQEGKDPETYKPKPRAWGNRIGKSPFIEHKGKYYIEVFYLNPGKVDYFVDGICVQSTDGIPGIPASSKNENKIIVRTHALDNIHKIRINGKELSQ